MEKPLTPLEILEVARVVAALQLINKGDFAKELEALKKEKEELERRYGVIPTLEAANKARAESESLKAVGQAEAKETAEATQKLEEGLRQRARELQEAVAAAKAEKDEAVSRQRKADQLLRSGQEALTKRSNELDVRQAALNKGEEKLADDLRKLSERVRNIKAAAAA